MNFFAVKPESQPETSEKTFVFDKSITLSDIYFCGPAIKEVDNIAGKAAEE